MLLNSLPKDKHFRVRFFASVCILGLIGLAFSTATFANTNSSNNQVLGVIEGDSGYKLKYTNTVNGGITFTGNALTLANYDITSNGAAGTFMSLDKESEDTPYPKGTTNDWTQNGSSSVLNLPDNSEILYARLIWGASYILEKKSLEDKISEPITLRTPKQKISVKADETFKTVMNWGDIVSARYASSADVTDIIKQSMEGTYSVSSVPAQIDRSDGSDGNAGWTLAVAYKNDTLPVRNISLFTGSETVDDQKGNAAEISGFATATKGKIAARLLVSTQEGDANLDGDEMRFGKDQDNLNTVNGPNNSVSNFFGGQINGDNGKINTSGSFGKENQRADSLPGGKRHGWDITNVDVSSQMGNNQTKAFAQGTTNKDNYTINAIGMQIDVNSASNTVQILVDKNQTFVGDILTYNILVKNIGSTDSENTKLKNIVPAGTQLETDSLKINGQTATSTELNNLDIGNIEPQAEVSIDYKVKVIERPKDDQFLNKATVDYTYQMNSAVQEAKAKAESNQVITTIGKNDVSNPTNPVKPSKPTKPRALDDKASTTVNKDVNIDIIKNDSDARNQLNKKSLKLNKKPKNGKVNFDLNTAQASYTPNTDYIGKDSFEYKICNTSNLCDIALVNITISADTTSSSSSSSSTNSSVSNSSSTSSLTSSTTSSSSSISSSSSSSSSSKTSSSIFFQSSSKNSSTIFVPIDDFTEIKTTGQNSSRNGQVLGVLEDLSMSLTRSGGGSAIGFIFSGIVVILSGYGLSLSLKQEDGEKQENEDK